MKLLACRVILSFLAAPIAGCAYVEERFRDDTGRPGFEAPYRAGETYRLRAEGRIVSVCSNACLPGKATERLELWSPKIVASNAGLPDYGQLVATVPAGATVRVDGLEHNYTFSFPPVPGDTRILRVYGTVESGGGRWTHVRIPDDQKARPSFVPGTYVMTYPPDYGFLERVGPECLQPRAVAAER